MIKLELTAILYSNKNIDLAYKLHKSCVKMSVNLVNCLNFVDLTIKTLQFKPQVIFCDMTTLNISSTDFRYFEENNEFKHIRFVCIGNDNHRRMLDNLNFSNIDFVNIDDIDNYLTDNVNMFLSNALDFIKESNDDILISNYVAEMLFMLGFSPKHIGYSYLKEIIKSIIINNGICTSLINEQYPNTAVKFKTSACNIERSIRNAINYAYKGFGAEKWGEVFNNYVFLDISKRPTNREFICMCVDKIFADKLSDAKKYSIA